jgi:hypothetical protein
MQIPRRLIELPAYTAQKSTRGWGIEPREIRAVIRALKSDHPYLNKLQDFLERNPRYKQWIDGYVNGVYGSSWFSEFDYYNVGKSFANTMMLDAPELDTNILVYRGFHVHAIEAINLTNVSVLSTSLLYNVAVDFCGLGGEDGVAVLLKIHVPRGTRVLWALQDEYKSYANQAELLLPAGRIIPTASEAKLLSIETSVWDSEKFEVSGRVLVIEGDFLPRKNAPRLRDTF